MYADNAHKIYGKKSEWKTIAFQNSVGATIISFHRLPLMRLTSAPPNQHTKNAKERNANPMVGITRKTQGLVLFDGTVTKKKENWSTAGCGRPMRGPRGFARGTYEEPA